MRPLTETSIDRRSSKTPRGRSATRWRRTTQSKTTITLRSARSS